MDVPPGLHHDVHSVGTKPFTFFGSPKFWYMVVTSQGPIVKGAV